MTQKERKEYIAKYNRRIKLFERQYTKPIYHAVRSQILDFTADIKENGLDDATKRMEMVLMNPRIGIIVKDLYKVVGVYAANAELREINASAKQLKGFGFNLEWIADLVNYFKDYLLTKTVIPITDHIKNEMRRVLILGQNNGWGIEQIIRNLEAPDLVLWRARMIARTEIGKAAFKGRQLGESKSEFELVREWIAAADHRTRHSHWAVDGDKVEPGQEFTVPVYKGKTRIGEEQMEGPGDPKASLGNIINCRCKTSARVKFENGRAVRKVRI